MEITTHKEASGAADLFKHENDSVDMLLQELNHDGPAPEPTNPDGPSPDESPVKPLNYQTQKQLGSPHDQKTALGPDVTDREYHADPLRKDFNSSSDTYVSDHDEGENLSHNLQEGEDADILSGNDPELQEPHATAVSPSKSIMKSSVSSGSPKKSVVFQPSLDTFHTYTPKDPEPSPPAEPAAFFNHLWQEVDQSATSHDTTASPPAPPPHTSSTITGLLTPSRDYLSSDDEASSQESADVDSMRKPVNRHSSLALKENPDVFLTPALQSQNDDLDNHLEQLEKAKTEETGVNIHRLSYHMEDYNPRLENNPFSALSNSLKLYVNSAHSSQSSLQSLMDSNRQLPAETIEKKSRGIQFNDGIKGFPDTVANLLIPLPGAEEDSLSDSSSVGSQFSFLQMKTESSQHPDHSYDQSYNLTEKSILNLLTSASNLDLSDGQLIKTESHEEKASLNFKQELVEPSSTENNTILTPRTIKSESPEIEVKQEQKQELAFSPEPLSSDEKDNETYVKREEQVNTPQVKSAPDENEVLEGCDDEVRIKPELDETNWPLLESANAVDTKKEEQEIVPSLENITSDNGLKGNDFSNLFENESELDKSDYQHSFAYVGNDASIEAHTFQVDEKAVILGPVKLVPSADNLSHSPTCQQEPVAAGQATGDDQESNISENDSGNVIRTKLETEHHNFARNSYSSDSADLDEYKDSVEYSFQSLAPPRSEVKESQLPQKLPCQAHDISDAYEKTNPSLIQDYDSSVLANSSNITPPMNMKLPVTDTDDDAFADLTQRLNENSKSFEESLSAEHDVVKTPANFLSIWHSQLLGRKVKKPVSTFYKVPSILTYNTADLPQGEKYHIPPSLQPKKFTDVNLVSTRVVSLSFEDLNVSAFLPELSQDSGIEDHFRSLMKDQAKLENEGSVGSVNGGNSQRRKSLESQSFLSDLERTKSRENLAMILRRKSLNETLRPGAILNSRKDSISTKRSKFHVPSFEIKRSNSILSPKNQYNDIFLDGTYVAPTIKAPGMKTLPSLDRDDVKRIMQMKQAMSLEEYSGLKKVGAPVSATQHKPSNKHEALQQRASIYCDSLASNSAAAAAKFRVHHQGMNRPLVDPSQVLTNISDESSARKRPLSFAPHGFDQGSRKLVVMSDQETHLSNEEVNQVLNTPTIEANDADETSLPDPYPNFVSLRNSPIKDSVKRLPSKGKESPMHVSSISTQNPFWVSGDETTSHINTSEAHSKRVLTGLIDKGLKNKVFVKSWTEISPERKPVTTSSDQNTRATRSSPIKISSPVKVVKQNGSVTGIVLDRKTKDVKIPNEIPNKKLRTHKSHLSAVSVPSNITSDRLTSHEAQSDASIERTDSVKARSRKSIVTDMPDEMGKLFFRVVGLKNVNVGEVKDRSAKFTITLDNGIHCIKTPDYQLDVSRVVIDKEFELSVSELLEFILTLKATYAKAKPTYKEIKERKVVKSKNKIGRLFGSKEIITTTKYVPQNGVDPLDSLFATDGSFARCYVDLDLYKSQITGQVCTYNLICYNEWATYTHNGEKIVKQPYPIAQLEVKMLYVPRREKYEILPTSIKSAYESLHDLRSEMYMALEGYLHQEGGDCETWKRRWFKLQGTSLIAHSEYSHKTRAKINLAKVAEVIYVNEENIGLPSSSYRNFSDILLMGNSFKIRFANDETIDFGAPSKTEKALWIKNIQEIVYRNKFRRQPWVMLMQEKNGDRRKLLVES